MTLISQFYNFELKICFIFVRHRLLNGIFLFRPNYYWNPGILDTLIIDEEPLHILSRLHHHRRPAYAPRLCSRFRVKHHSDETGCFYPRIKHTQHYCVGIGKRVCEPLMILIFISKLLGPSSRRSQLAQASSSVEGIIGTGLRTFFLISIE